MSLLSVPAIVVAPDDLLASAQRLVDAETAAFEADPDVHVSCRPNCNSCCEHAVAITAAEHREIAAAVEALADDVRHQIRDRAEAIMARVATLTADDGSPLAIESSGFGLTYFGLAEPCPLLVDGSCSVRAVRPLMCRQYLMSSDPVHCGDRSLEHAVPIPRRRRVSDGFRSVSERFGEGEVRFLPAALLDDTPPPPPEAIRLSGPRLARRLMNC